MSNTANVKWQSHVRSLSSGISRIYTTKEFADVTLKINKQAPIKAHKFVLSARSSVFKTKLLDSALEEVVIEDESITAVGFEILLRYIYTNVVDIEDKMSVIEAYQTANYFKQEELIAECERRIESWVITKEDVWLFLDAGFTIPKVRDKCLTFIRNNGIEALSHPSFLQLSYVCVDNLLDTGVLKNVPTMLCVNRILEWAANRHTQPVDYKIVRESLGVRTEGHDKTILGRLGIETLNNEELNSVVTNYRGLLTPFEVMQFMLHSSDTERLPSWCAPLR